MESIDWQCSTLPGAVVGNSPAVVASIAKAARQGYQKFRSSPLGPCEPLGLEQAVLRRAAIATDLRLPPPASGVTLLKMMSTQQIPASRHAVIAEVCPAGHRGFDAIQANVVRHSVEPNVPLFDQPPLTAAQNRRDSPARSISNPSLPFDATHSYSESRGLALIPGANQSAGGESTVSGPYARPFSQCGYVSLVPLHPQVALYEQHRVRTAIDVAGSVGTTLGIEETSASGAVGGLLTEGGGTGATGFAAQEGSFYMATPHQFGPSPQHQIRSQQHNRRHRAPGEAWKTATFMREKLLQEVSVLVRQPPTEIPLAMSETLFREVNSPERSQTAPVGALLNNGDLLGARQRPAQPLLPSIEALVHPPPPNFLRVTTPFDCATEPYCPFGPLERARIEAVFADDENPERSWLRDSVAKAEQEDDELQQRLKLLRLAITTTTQKKTVKIERQQQVEERGSGFFLTRIEEPHPSSDGASCDKKNIWTAPVEAKLRSDKRVEEVAATRATAGPVAAETRKGARRREQPRVTQKETLRVQPGTMEDTGEGLTERKSEKGGGAVHCAPWRRGFRTQSRSRSSLRGGRESSLSPGATSGWHSSSTTASDHSKTAKGGPRRIWRRAVFDPVDAGRQERRRRQLATPVPERLAQLAARGPATETEAALRAAKLRETSYQQFLRETGTARALQAADERAARQVHLPVFRHSKLLV